MSPKSAANTQPSAEEEVKQPPAVTLPESQTTTALALVTQSITELNKVALEVAALEPKYKGVVFDVKTTAGMKAACEARLAIRKPRYTIQKMQKDAKTPLNALKKGIDDQVDAVIARIAAIEDPVHQQIVNEETRKENEKKAREEAEAARVATIHERIEQDIRQAAFAATNRTSADIEVIIRDVVAIAIDDSFAEFKQQAEGAKATTLIRLRAALANAQSIEAERKRLETEKAENERVRQENEAKSAAERARIAEDERKAREAREAEEAEFREQQRVHEMRMQELQGLRQQVFIATVGRLGVRAGGTRECIVDTLKETQDWPITEENFGKVLFGAAQKIKADVIAQIEQLLTQWDERQRIADENSALQAQRDAQAAEAARLEAEGQRLAREQADADAARQAEEQRLAAEREQLERDQEALRLEREKPTNVPDSVEENRIFEIMGERKAAQIERESDSVAQEPAVETSIAAESEPLLASLDLKVYLLMDSVCRFAKEWAVFQHRDSKLDQKTDRKLAARAKEAEANLLAVVEQLP